MKSHSGKRIMKDDTTQIISKAVIIALQRRQLRESSVFERRDKGGTCPVKRWAGLLYLLVRDTSSRDHISIVLGLSLLELLQNGSVLLSQTTYLLKGLSLCNLPLPRFHPSFERNRFLKRQTTDACIDYTFNGFRVHKAMEFGF